MNDYNLIVIGAGPGGYAAALKAAELGLKTAVVEKGRPGGTCVNRGCVPTKALLHVSGLYHSMAGTAGLGITVGVPGDRGTDSRPGATADVRKESDLAADTLSAAEIVPVNSAAADNEPVSGAAAEPRTGLAVPELRKIFSYKDGITEKLSRGVEEQLKKARVKLISAKAVIAGPHLIKLYSADEGADGSLCAEAYKASGGTGVAEASGVNGQDSCIGRLTADNILIASGSEPFIPAVPGMDIPGVMTSDEILDGQERLFKSLVIVGGGVIGVELGVFYSDLGCRVTIIEGMDRLLPGLDRELGQNLALIMKKQGVKVFTGTMLTKIESGPDGGLAVYGESRGKEIKVTAEACLCAIGRKPYTRGLFAEGLQPEMDRARIRVDECFRTSIEGVYAIGDVSTRIQLAHVATAEGIAAAKIIAAEQSCDNAVEDAAYGNRTASFSKAAKTDYAEDGAGSNTGPLAGARRACPPSGGGGGTGENLSIVPSCIYCRPEIASVGLSEAEARKTGRSVKTGKCIMFSNARTMIEDPGRCFMKIVADAGTGEILGGQLMCPDASDMISEITLAIVNHLTVDDMLKVMRPHPTFEEAMTGALKDLKAKL